MIEALVVAGLRATILAALTGLALSVFRVRQAAFRHACWTLVLFAMITMPGLSLLLPKIPLPLLPTNDAGISAVATAVTFEPIASTSVPASPATSLPVVEMVYALVASGLLMRWISGYVLGLFLIRSAARATIDSVRVPPRTRCLESERVSVPMTFGWLRPVILLPSGYREWTKGRLRAVLAHEAAHVRRGDFFTTCLAALGKAALWFNPVAWWLEWRLATLAEEAADDSAAGRHPRAYAQMLVQIAHDARPGRVHGLAVVRPAGLTRRVNRLLDPEYRHMQKPGRYLRAITGLLVAALVVLSASIVVTEARTRPPRVSIGMSALQEDRTTEQTEPAQPEPQDDSVPQEENTTGPVPVEDSAPEAGSFEGGIPLSKVFFFDLWDRNIAGDSTGSMVIFPDLWDRNIAREPTFRGQEERESVPQDEPASPGEAGAADEPATNDPRLTNDEADPSPLLFNLGEPGITPPRILERVEPSITESAREAGIREATVILDTIVRRDGTVDVRGVVSTEPGGQVGEDLAGRASEAVAQWRFAPPTRNGDPIDLQLKIEVRYTIQ